MVTTKVFITASAFTLAITGALITSSKESALTSFNGRDYSGRCVLTDPPLENQCAITNWGSPCTVLASPDEDYGGYVDAYLSLSALPTCLLILRQPYPL